MKAWLDIIGLGEEGLEGLRADLYKQITEAELIVGGARHLAMLRSLPKSKVSKKTIPQKRITWAIPLSKTIDDILRHRGQKVVVLATGDPMHFGIGVTLARRIPAKEMRIHPGISAFSLAAARLAWPLAEVECITLHGRPLAALAGVIADRRRLFVLSHDGTTPAKVARQLMTLGFGDSKITVLEHMGGDKEARHDALARNWGRRRCADLNTIAIECVASSQEKSIALGFGLDDERFSHDGKITKREIRAATLAALSPKPGQILWDVGAGSGSIAIEWLRQDSSMEAFAIESDPARCRSIERNAESLGVPRLILVSGEAPKAFKELPSPHAIFIGGGLAKLGLIEAAWARLLPRGTIVANAVTIEGEEALLRAYKNWGGEMRRLSVERLSSIGTRWGWKPLMPVMQWSQRKK